MTDNNAREVLEDVAQDIIYEANIEDTNAPSVRETIVGVLERRGFSLPRTVRTVAGLPVGTVVWSEEHQKHFFHMSLKWWWCLERPDEGATYTDVLIGPATVLHEGGAS